MKNFAQSLFEEALKKNKGSGPLFVLVFVEAGRTRHEVTADPGSHYRSWTAFRELPYAFAAARLSDGSWVRAVKAPGFSEVESGFLLEAIKSLDGFTSRIPNFGKTLFEDIFSGFVRGEG